MSIIIPAYNAQEYIEQCLNSVCIQTYSNLQIIVVDDGSTDRTFQIISDIAAVDKRILLLHQQNKGVSAARNNALSYVDGEYITFLDSDDTMKKDAVSVLVRAIEDSSAEWVSCQYSRWDESNIRLEDYSFIEGKRQFHSDEDRIDFLLKKYLNYLVGYEVWDKLFITDIIKTNHLLFPDDTKIGEDLAFNIKYLMYVKSLICIPDRCVIHVIRNDSAMGTHKDLADRIRENDILLKDIWNFAVKADKELFCDKFILIYVKLMENAYIRHTPVEVANAFGKGWDTGFSKMIYQKLTSNKEEIVAIYPSEVARIKYSYHMYVRGRLCGESISDRFKRFIYDYYRRLRGREILEKWKMPY